MLSVPVSRTLAVILRLGTSDSRALVEDFVLLFTLLVTSLLSSFPSCTRAAAVLVKALISAASRSNSTSGLKTSLPGAIMVGCSESKSLEVA